MAKTFSELAKEARKAGTAKSQTATWFEFKKKGDTVIGRLIGKRTMNGAKFDGTFIKYAMETDDGPIEFKLGSASDQDTGQFLIEGAIYEITMLPDEDVGKGSPRHCYEVVLIPSEEETF